MAAVASASKTQETPQFELTDLRIPFVNIGKVVIIPDTVIVAFKTKEIAMEFFKEKKQQFYSLAILDRRDNQPNSLGIRLQMQCTLTNTVNDILKELRFIFGEDKVNGFLKKYSD